ncbi:MAG TPA: zf-HC2 domain-containing protein [Acidimicrobiales bacterium]|nr:zf-HC2 domain-containing protein [Acidimicrobiales bacterium]
MADQPTPHFSAPSGGGHVTDLAPELALGILPEAEAEAARNHLRTCPACSAEVASLMPVTDRLLELVPGTEPPLGFDRRVLAEVSPSAARRFKFRHRSLLTVASAAAAAALVFGTIGWIAGRGTKSNHVQTEAALVSNGRHVGEVDAYGHPAWLSISVHGVTNTGRVTCEIVYKDGHTWTMGSFDLVKGSGMWSTPDPSGFSNVTEARLVGTDGHILAVAHF